MHAHGFPFSFATESSVDLAQDQELMDLMRECNFGAVFLGIETPDTDSLKLTKKSQKHLNAFQTGLSETLKTARKCSFHVRVNSSCQLLPDSSGVG